jgi:phosphoenolpyruvate carboxykinase (ATP)
VAYQANGSRVEWNPTAARLRELTEEMPNAALTEFGNVAVKARVDSRSTRATYIVDDSTNSRGQTITRAEYDRVAAIQDAHIAKSHMVVVDGYIGSDPQFRTRARLIMEAANANVAGMQKQLYYPAEAGYDPAAWAPDLTVIYTPNVPVPGYPDNRLIAVDLGASITRVLNSDYFGESKKGGLRMWNNIVYNRGGLALHAGCKVIPSSGPRTPTSATRWRRRSRAWTTPRSSSRAGSTKGRAGRTSTTPWWPGSSGSGRNSSAPSPAWTSP